MPPDLTDPIVAATEDARILLEAKLRVRQTDTEQGILRSRYNQLRFWVSPNNGDQWPLKKKPGMIYLTANFLWPVIQIASRIESILPRVTLKPPSQDALTKLRAEATEKIILESLEITEWAVWFNVFNQVKNLLGRAVIKPFWNEEENRPDLTVIEAPENLRIGWGNSDFTRIDWTLFEYEISPFEAEKAYPNIKVVAGRDGKVSVVGGTKHDDPLGQLSSSTLTAYVGKERNDYEQQWVQVWDYWYKKLGEDRKPQVWNAIIVGTAKGRTVASNQQYDYLPDIPYIVVENDHKPGSPDGRSTIEDLLQPQEEMNRAMSHWLQTVADNVDPAWQATGEGADSVPAGIVPKAGEILALGANIEISPIEKPTNTVAVEQVMGGLWDMVHKLSGLPEIVFGQLPGSQTSGRATAVQVEAVANRLVPRRDRSYAGLKELILFWQFMIEKRDWKVDVQPIEAPQPPVPGQQALGLAEGEQLPEKMGLASVVKGLNRWNLIAPEITPRDIFENTQNEIQKVNARMLSLETSMDNTGVDNPLEEMEKIRGERSDATLFPGDVQAQVAAAATLLQMKQQIQQMAMELQAMQAQQGGGGGGQAMDMAAQAQGSGFLQRQENQAQPAGDQVSGGEGAGLAPTGPGGAAPAGSPAPGLGTAQTLVRGQPNGSAQVLQQLAMRRNV